MRFTVYFNSRRQWFIVELHDVTPNTFERRGGGRWGYYQPEAERQNRRGKFGEVHLVASRVRPDLVVHELHHLFIYWMRCKHIAITPINEERLVMRFDEMVRNFYREYERNF